METIYKKDGAQQTPNSLFKLQYPWDLKVSSSSIVIWRRQIRSLKIAKYGNKISSLEGL